MRATTKTVGLKPAAIAWGLLMLANFASTTAAAADKPLIETTVTYKQVGDTKIEADIYHFGDDQIRPVVVHIHGGALMMGSRRGLHYNLRQICEQSGIAAVSIDYRLAPEVLVPDIILIPNGEHGLGGGDPQLISKAHERAAAFLREHLE